MLRDLVLFRHGKAVRPHEAPDDYDRPLTARGVADSARQAGRLQALGCAPDVALVSTALRASQTWDQAARVFPRVAVRASRALYLAAPEVYLEGATAAKAAGVIVVAHDPGLHDLARRLMRGAENEDAGGGVRALRADFPTAGIAWFKADPSARSGFALHAFLDPEDDRPGAG
jgi:phosphohistidine phosphatase